MHEPDSFWRLPLALAPVVPVAFVVWGGVRATREMDELERRVALEGSAFALTTIVLATIAYGFLQHAGLPPINWMFVGLAAVALTAIGRRVARLKYR
jgi:hypothetical protein